MNGRTTVAKSFTVTSELNTGFIRCLLAYISCYDVDYTRIIDLFYIQKIDKNFPYLDYSRFKIKHSHTHLGFDLSPTENCDPDNINENLKRQKGCFVLYDNNGSDFTFDKTIDDLFFYENWEKEKVIKEYRLPYNKIFGKPDFEGMEGISLSVSIRRSTSFFSCRG